MIALVRSVIAAATESASRLPRSSISAKTQVAPRSAIAVAVEVNAKLGTITSSSGPSSSSSPAISSAC